MTTIKTLRPALLRQMPHMSSIEKDRQLRGTGPEPQNVVLVTVGPRAGRPRFRLVIVSSLKGEEPENRFAPEAHVWSHEPPITADQSSL